MNAAGQLPGGVFIFWHSQDGYAVYAEAVSFVK
jgi:hypothetical protein